MERKNPLSKEILAQKFLRGDKIVIDLNNDEKIENDTEIEEAEMRKTLEQMLSAMPSSILRLEMLEKLEHT